MKGSNYMLELIVFGIILLPILIFIIYSIIHPEEVMLWGNRWKYKGEIEPTEEYIKYLRATSIINLLLIISIITILFNSLYGTIFLVLSVSISLYYFLIK